MKKEEDCLFHAINEASVGELMAIAHHIAMEIYEKGNPGDTGTAALILDWAGQAENNFHEGVYDV